MCNAQESPKAAPKAVAALRLFFELGLPDTANANWVEAEGDVYSGQLLSYSGWGGRDESGGNAWLLAEKDGELDLLMADGKRVRAARLKEDGEPVNPKALESSAHQVTIKPADWKKDASGFLARLKKAAGKPNTADDEGDYSLQVARSQCGPALLFLAHAHRRGDTAIAEAALPLVFALAGSPDAALDSAISSLANQRLDALADEWVRVGDANAYAAALEKLAAQFSRGWKHQAAARALAQRLRMPATVAPDDADVKAGADLLLSLKAAELASLPPRPAWLLPASNDGAVAGNVRAARYSRRRAMAEVSGEGEPSAAVVAFFEKRHEAARVLAHLLSDQRMLRMQKNSGQGRDYYPGYSYDSEEEGVASLAYQIIPRPMELGEFCAQLLQAVTPSSLQRNVIGRSPDKAAVLAWIASVAEMSDEELAWEYMRGASGSSDNFFQTGLAFLLEKGSEATSAKLDEVFLDPAVWSGGAEELLPQLETHAKKRAGDPEAFREKLLAVIKKHQEEELREQKRYMRGAGDEYAKEYRKRHAAFLKRVEQAFKPVKLEDQLAEILAAPEEDALSSVHSLESSLSKVKFAEAEGQLLQAAAQAKSDPIKRALLGIAMQRASNPEDDPARTFNAETTAAIEQLLEDESSAKANAWRGTMEVADMAAMALLMPRWKPGEHQNYYQVAMMSPAVGQDWLRKSARALVSGSAAPPLPSASRADAGELAAWLKELEALPARDCASAMRAKSPDLQLALAEHLQKRDVAWPESFQIARMTIARISGDGALAAIAEPWKGRVLDEDVSKEITAVLEKELRAGKGLSISALIDPALGGVTLHIAEYRVRLNEGQISRFELKLPAGNPEPVGVISRQITSGKRVLVMYPVWENPAQTKAWQEQDEKDAAANPKEEEPKSSSRSDAAGFSKAFQAMRQAAPEFRAPGVSIGWFSALIGEEDEEASISSFEDE